MSKGEMETHQLIGMKVRVVIHEGSPPLTDGSEVAGIVVRLGPKGGAYKDYGIVVEPTEPQFAGLEGHRLFVTPRYKGLPLPVPDEIGRVIVNVALYSPSDVVVGRAIGALEVLGPASDRETRLRES